MWVPLGYCTYSPKAGVVVNDHETMLIKLRHSYVDTRVGGLVQEGIEQEIELRDEEER
ncbi:hypothetical protein GBA52_020528 [Prunus armeniaca]|nr:hypothetical protein GBA52_020528 [Prunus armeniaca]